MKLYSVSSTNEVERNKAGNIEAFLKEDLEFVIECLDGSKLLELETKDENIVGQSDFYVDTLKMHSLSDAQVIRAMDITDELITQITSK